MLTDESKFFNISWMSQFQLCFDFCCVKEFLVYRNCCRCFDFYQVNDEALEKFVNALLFNYYQCLKVCFQKHFQKQSRKKFTKNLIINNEEVFEFCCFSNFFEVFNWFTKFQCFVIVQQFMHHVWKELEQSEKAMTD